MDWATVSLGNIPHFRINDKERWTERARYLDNKWCVFKGRLPQPMGSLIMPYWSRDRKMLQGTGPPPSGDPNQTPRRVGWKALVEMGCPITREFHCKPQDLPE